MARTRSQRQAYADLLARYGKEIADAFLSAIDDITSAAELQRLTAAIEAGQIEEALEALHIDPAAYNDMLDAIQRSYNETGRIATDALPKRGPDGTVLTFRFDGRNPAAERWLSDHSSRLVTRIVADQREAVRSALRAGMAAGDNPRTTALRIVGRINWATGQRTGGIVGLSGPYEEYVRSARIELASGDPALLRNYLNRAARNKVFDRSVIKAINDGTPIPAETIRKATTTYSSSLLKRRGDHIGTNETFSALEAAKEEAHRQAVESGKLAADDITKIWRHLGNENARMDHVAMSGKSVRYDRPFTMPDGTQMRFPHDPAAPVKHTAGCHCQTDYKVNFFSRLR